MFVRFLLKALFWNVPLCSLARAASPEVQVQESVGSHGLLDSQWLVLRFRDTNSSLHLKVAKYRRLQDLLVGVVVSVFRNQTLQLQVLHATLDVYHVRKYIHWNR